MQKLIEKVSNEAGISQEESKKAIESVRQYIKDATPHFFHQQLDVILNGGTLSDAMRKKFDEMRDEVEEAAKDFGKKAEQFANDISRKISDTFKKSS